MPPPPLLSYVSSPATQPPTHPPTHTPPRQLRIVEATPALAPRLAQACASLAAAHKLAGEPAAAEACLERLIAGAEGSGDGGARAAAAEAAENLGVMLMSRGEEARGTEHLAAAYALRRGLLQGGGCTQADVARARLLLGMARAQGRRGAFVKACAEGDVKTLLKWKDER